MHEWRRSIWPRRLRTQAVSKSASNDLINSVVLYIQAAADKLLASKFSDSAISKFRGAIAGQLKNTSRRIVEIAWADGNGSGDVPYSIASDYFEEQMGFLGNFIVQISENRGERKIPGGAFRAAMYGESLGQCYQKAYFKARGSRLGLPDLPAYPRDGSTECLTNCRCQWSIKKLSDVFYEARWKLGPVEHCPTCIDRGDIWNPISIVREMGRSGSGELELGPWSMRDARMRQIN